MEKKYPNQLVVIGVHSPKFDNEKNSQSIQKAMQRYEVSHPVINDANRRLWTAYRVQSWPTVALIDPEGYLVGGLADEKIFARFDKAIEGMIRTHRAKKTLNEKPLRFQEVRAESGSLCFPGKVLADAASKRLFIADSTHHRIVITDLDGKLIAVAGNGTAGKVDGPFAKARFADPQGLALKGDTLYVADRRNHMIRALDLKTQTVKSVAGTGVQGRDIRQGGPALRESLNSPWDLLVLGNVLYIAMAGHHQIWTLDLARQRVAPFAGNGMENIKDGAYASSNFAQPSGLSTDGKTLYVADSEVSAIRAIGQGSVRTIVGTGLFDFGDVDGTGATVRLQHALGVVYVDGTLFVADTYNSKIKVIDPLRRTCTTFVGGTSVFNEPGGISYANGKLYVADTNAHRIRVVDVKTRAVSTLTLQGVEAPEKN